MTQCSESSVNVEIWNTYSLAKNTEIYFHLQCLLTCSVSLNKYYPAMFCCARYLCFVPADLHVVVVSVDMKITNRQLFDTLSDALQSSEISWKCSKTILSSYLCLQDDPEIILSFLSASAENGRKCTEKGNDFSKVENNGYTKTRSRHGAAFNLYNEGHVKDSRQLRQFTSS